MRCEEIMSRNPATLPIDAKVMDAARLMAEKDVGFIPLVDKNGVCAGTVTDRDIVIRCIAKGLEPKQARLSDFGGNPVVCVLGDDDIGKAQSLMAQHKVQRILVCDKHDAGGGHKPIGVISLQNLAGMSQEEVGEAVKKVKEDRPSIH